LRNERCLVLYFSADLLNFKSTEESKYSHYSGGLASLENSLVAIGGYYINKVEVLINETWTQNIIENVASATSRIWGFSTIVINNTIYIFGMFILALMCLNVTLDAKHINVRANFRV